MEINSLNIRLLRKKLGLKQSELAQLIGVSRNTVINYESGKQIPESKIEVLKRVLNDPLGITGIEKSESNVVQFGDKEIKISKDIEDFVNSKIKTETEEIQKTLYKVFKKLLTIETELLTLKQEAISKKKNA